jgi:hypothetical protein
MNSTSFLQRASLDNATFFKRTAFLCAIWLLVGLIISFARITHPAFGLEGDLPLHYHITRSFARSFEEGDLLPRWAGLLDGGNGDALFTFYPSLPYLISVIVMKLLRIDVLTSLRIVSLLILIIAQASAYNFARAFFNRRYSLIASLFYVALPAFPLIGLKICLFANAFALSLVPLAMLGAHELLIGERRARGLILFALGMSAIILSHVITTYLCGIAIALMVLIYLPQVGWRGIARLAAGGLLVFALTAFFLVPLLVELKWVRVDLQVARHNYRDYFLFAKTQDDSNFRKMWSSFNHSLSYITLAQTVLTFLFCLACLPILRKRNRMARPFILGFTLAAFALIISLPWSDVIWRYLPGLKSIQFPWRFLPFVSLGCGLVVAAARAPQENNQSSWQTLKPIYRAMISLLLSWVVVANLILIWAIVRIDEPGITSGQAAKLLESPDVKKLPFEEAKQLDNKDDSLYVAYTANHYYYRPITAGFDIYPPTSQPGGLSILSGRGRVVSQQLNIERRQFVVECEEPIKARIETYRYPHWIARLNEREINIDIEAGTGLMLIDLPAGMHNLMVTFELRNQNEIWARQLSLLAWVLLIGWIIRKGYYSTRGCY